MSVATTKDHHTICQHLHEQAQQAPTKDGSEELKPGDHCRFLGFLRYLTSLVPTCTKITFWEARWDGSMVSMMENQPQAKSEPAALRCAGAKDILHCCPPQLMALALHSPQGTLYDALDFADSRPYRAKRCGTCLRKLRASRARCRSDEKCSPHAT